MNTMTVMNTGAELVAYHGYRVRVKSESERRVVCEVKTAVGKALIVRVVGRSREGALAGAYARLIAMYGKLVREIA